MRRGTFIASLLVILLAAGLSAAAAVEQSTYTREAKPNLLQAGFYNDLTFWRQMKLGAASLISPDIVTKARVAYKYDDQQLLANNSGFLKDLLVTGKAAVGKVLTNGIVIDKTQDWNTMASEAIIDALKKKGITAVVVSSQEVPQFGQGIPIVTFDPKGAVKMDDIPPSK